MPHFDYKIEVFAYNQTETEKKLCELGDDGWELVAVDFDARRYIFKKIRYHENYKTKDQDSDNQGERT